jgi:hypothetical protein
VYMLLAHPKLEIVLCHWSEGLTGTDGLAGGVWRILISAQLNSELLELNFLRNQPEREHD